MASKQTYSSEKAFTIVELVVAVGIFSVFSLGVAVFLSQTFGRLGIESRAALAAQELQNALNLLSCEFRMGTSISPYLPGLDPSAVKCNDSLEVTSNSIRFLVSHDDTNATNGIKAYYVGYIYDESRNELRRGMIESASTASCSIPGVDPIGPGASEVLAKNVVRVDTNGDSVLEPAFSLSSQRLSVNLGLSISGPGGTGLEQSITTAIALRKP